MSYDSHVNRYELYVGCALVAAHAQEPANGFRQRDVKFLIELFSNWQRTSTGVDVLPIQQTQIMRYINQLIDEGMARKVNRKGAPRYRLTRIGLIEILERQVSSSYVHRRDDFFFLYYYLSSYSGIITRLVEDEGALFPPALKAELEGLLDVRELVERERSNVESELEFIEARISDARKSAAMVEDLIRKNIDIEEIIKEVQRKYPYELNSQKPLTELISQIPAETRLWELKEGNLRRCEIIWEPAQKLLAVYLREIDKLG